MAEDNSMGLKGWLTGPKSKHANTSRNTLQLDKKRLAVLPITNLSPDSHDEYFADGLTEELITTLSQLKGLQVIARTSVMPYKGAGKRVSDIGRELEVGSMLEGSVRKVANKVRVTTQLVDTGTQAHVWSSTYDRELDDIFAIQSDIAKRVANALRVELHPIEERRIHRVPTKDLEAYELYLRGRQLMYDRTEKSLGEAKSLFDLALERDPDFAAAYAGIADCLYLSTNTENRSYKEGRAAAKAIASKALELDDNLAEAHSTMGAILMSDHKYEESEFEFKRAISLNPSYAQAHHWYALLLALLERHDEARLQIELARKTDPFSPIIATATGMLYWYADRGDDAVKQWQAVKERWPGFFWAYYFLGLIFLESGKTKEAFENLNSPVLEKSIRGLRESVLAYAYSVTGRREEAFKILANLAKPSGRENNLQGSLAIIYLGLGDDDKLFECLNRAVDEGDDLTTMLRLPIFKRIRQDPRFSSFLRRMNLKP